MRCSWSRFSLPTGLCFLLASASLALAQPGLQLPPLPSDAYPQKHRKILDRYPQIPSLPPAFAIPVGKLGFSVPGENYLLRRQSLISLDFIDEDRILFTFHVSGLMERDADDPTGGGKQQIKALVLKLPSGAVESQGIWVVPDRSRYLWMLNDGHFLVRTPDGLDEGDALLHMSSYLRLPGRLLWIQMDPGQQMLVANSLEPATAGQKPTEAAPVGPGPRNAGPKEHTQDEQGVLVVRTLKRASGDVIHVARFPWTSQTVDWPMNSEGYLERTSESGLQWLLTLKPYTGEDRVLAHVASRCPPVYNFITDSELLMTTCDPVDGSKLAAMSTSGHLLWGTRIATNTMWPLLMIMPNGLRVARETLILNHTAERYKRMLTTKDIQGQVVNVIDMANGKILLEAPATPIFDGGGNVAISPSGQRVAILSAGAIQVFQLAAPPPPATLRDKK